MPRAFAAHRSRPCTRFWASYRQGHLVSTHGPHRQTARSISAQAETTSSSAGMTSNRDLVTRLRPTWTQHIEVSQYPRLGASARSKIFQTARPGMPWANQPVGEFAHPMTGDLVEAHGIRDLPGPCHTPRMPGRCRCLRKPATCHSVGHENAELRCSDVVEFATLHPWPNSIRPLPVRDDGCQQPRNPVRLRFHLVEASPPATPTANSGDQARFLPRMFAPKTKSPAVPLLGEGKALDQPARGVPH
jgi:hypothetical protein